MNWFTKWLLAWLIDNLTEEMIKEWADKLKMYLVPLLKSGKGWLIAELKKAAAKTENKLDDAAVDALDKFIDAFMPDNPLTL